LAGNLGARDGGSPDFTHAAGALRPHGTCGLHPLRGATPLAPRRVPARRTRPWSPGRCARRRRWTPAAGV